MIFGGVIAKNQSHPVYVIIGGDPDTKVGIQGHLSYNNRDIENGWVHHYKDRYGPNDFLVERSRKSQSTGTLEVDASGNPIGNPQSTSVRNYEMYNSFLYVDDAIKYGETNKRGNVNLYDYTFVTPTYADNSPNTKPRWSEQCKPVLINVAGGTSVTITGTNDIQTLSCNNERIKYVYNLIPDLMYTYTVKNGNTTVRTGTFKAEGKIRMIRMDGVRNMRDLGGYHTVDGTQRIRYGLIFRGGALLPVGNNTNSTGAYNITQRVRQTPGLSGTVVNGGATAEDAEEFKRLGIKIDYDLRGYASSLNEDNIGSSASGAEFFNSSDGITYKKRTSSASSYRTMYSKASELETFLDTIISLNGTGALYLHCHQGRDRTGTYAAILFALLGIGEGNIIEDYELTSLWGNATTRYMFQYLTSDSSMTDAATSASGRMFPFAATSSINAYVLQLFSSLSSKIDTVKGILLENIPTEPEPSDSPKRYIKSITSTPYTGNGTINGDVITWPLLVTLDDNSTMSYQLFRESNLVKETYGNATFTYYNNAAINQGYIDANGNLTYDLSGDNWALDCSYIQSITLPCTSNSSYTRTFTFTDTENSLVTVQKTWNSSKTGVPSYNYAGFDTYMNNKYTFTALTGLNLYYHVSNDFDPKTGTGFKVTKFPKESDREGHMFAKEIGTDTIIKIVNPKDASDSMNRVAIVNTNTALTQTELPTSTDVVLSNSDTTLYSRVSNPTPTSSKSDAKVLYLERNLTVYIRNKTDKAHSYIIFFSIYTVAQVGSAAAVLIYEGTPIPTAAVRLTQWQPSDVSNGVSGYYYLSDPNFLNWSHYEIPVNLGDTVTVKLNSPSRPACCYVESNSGMISLMNTRLSDIVFGTTVNVNTHVYFYPNGDKTYDGTAYGTVATTESSGRYLATHTINIRNTGRFTISVKRLFTGDDTLYTINTTDANCIQMGIYVNGTLIYGKALSF